MSAEPKAKPAVFLDRDGTINREVDYLADPAQLELLQGAGEAIARLNRAGYFTVVITNQSGIARGLLTEERLAEIHARLDELLRPFEAHIDAYYYCPHHPDIGESPYRRDCDCRKPKPGMFERAAREHDLDLSSSFAVGDSPRDLQAAAALQVPGYLVETGKAVSAQSRERFETVPNLASAIESILGS